MTNQSGEHHTLGLLQRIFGGQYTKILAACAGTTFWSMPGVISVISLEKILCVTSFEVVWSGSHLVNILLVTTNHQYSC